MLKNKISGKSRFLKSLVPALLGLFAVFAIIGFVHAKLDSGFGLLLGFIAGGCFGFGVLLAYWNAVDWVNLGIIRKQLADGVTAFKDGQLVAHSGIVRVDGAPMVSPITRQECAAYTYTISISRERHANRGGSRQVLAQGFHMLPASIKGSIGALRLGALPSMEDDLRINENGERTDVVREKLRNLINSAPSGGEMERVGTLLEAKYSVDGEIHKDYCQLTELGDGKVFVVEEEVLPVNQAMCVVGTFDQRTNGITAGKRRFGPDLMVYRGTMDEVLVRIGGDIGLYTKFVVGLLGIAVAVLGYAIVAGSW